MASFTPHHRYLKVNSAFKKKEPLNSDDSLMECLYRHLVDRKDTSVPKEVRFAYRIYCDTYQKEVLDTFLLVKIPFEEIEFLLEIPANVVEVYNHLFFDTRVFQSRLDRESYARKYTAPGEDGAYGMTLKTEAITKGPEYLKASFGSDGRYDIPPSVAVKQLITQGYLLSKAAHGHAVDSKKSKEARQWASTCLSSIGSLTEAAKEGQVKERDLTIRLKLMDYDPKVDETPDETISLKDVISKPKDAS